MIDEDRTRRGDVAVRAATPADARSLAEVHVQSWRKTDANLLPASLIGADGLARQ